MSNQSQHQLRVALIGGMDRNQHQLIALADQHGAELECHTGDVHGHRAETLRSVIERSDVVVVLTDVNSHGGVIQARRWAQNYGKSVVLLRRCSPSKLTSLIDNLRTARAALSMKKLLLGASLIATALSVLSVSGVARADDTPDCASLPKPFYGLGGSASKPYIGKLAVTFAAAADPQTLVYQAPGACVGVNGLLGATTITGTASYWDKTSGKELTCNLSVSGDPVQFANSGNFATSCPGVSTLPSGFVDVEGPIQPYDLIVPTGSSESSISAEAAYFVFGFGAAGQAAPWTDETELSVRDGNSAAQLFISLAIGVPAGSFKGVNTKSNSGTVTAVAGATNPNAAIGLVSGEVADANAATVRILAFQAKGQTCGYTPDQAKGDKLNVRTGQYDIWGQQHFLAAVDGSGAITTPAVAQLFDVVAGKADPPDGSKALDAAITAGAIPACAMEVSRSADLGDVSSYAPAEPCGCYFDFKATGATSCAACTADADCSASASHCRVGYCEVN